MNTVLPVVTVATALVALVALNRRRYRFVHAVNAVLATSIVGAASAGRLVFPLSAAGRWWFVLAPGVAAAIWTFRRRVSAIAWLLAALLGVGVGATAVATQRAGEPATHPLGHEYEGDEIQGPRDDDRLVRVTRGNVRLLVDPRLTFLSRSPDKCWTIFAPRGTRDPGPQRLTASERDGESWSIDARTVLSEPVYSHLNYFSYVQVEGFKRLSLRFSACEGTFEVKTRGYPFGEPARFAYVDAKRRFLVVEASSGEKGPFTVLGEGTLPADAPLTITLVDEQNVVCTITFQDLAAQLSTALSPTAGWGVSQNAIEFGLDDAATTANIYLALAATSIGRGWDSVGHRAGVYRNRITIR